MSYILYFCEKFPQNLFFFDFGFMYCDLWSRAETIFGNTVGEFAFLKSIFVCSFSI